jgi:hypothetical protein
LRHRKSAAVIFIFALLITVIMVWSAFFGTTIHDVSAVTVSQNLGVYWNRYCTKRVYSIDWGALSPGALEEVMVYVRNYGRVPITLNLTAVTWSPESASHYLNFTWNCKDPKLRFYQIEAVYLKLTVDPSITGINKFSFNIIFDTSQ